MGKLLRGISCALACLLLAATVPQAGLAAEIADPSQGAKTAPLLIILLDVSGTMNGADRDSKAIKWSAGLSANCGELGIEVKMFTFGENITDIDSKKILNAGIIYHEARTNHLDAIEEAKSIVDKDPTRKICIVMLSDGALDFIGRGLENVKASEPRTEDEKHAIDCFLDEGEELGKSGCKLFLVGCGAAEGNIAEKYDIKGFGMLYELGKKTNCEFLHINEMNLSELTRRVFISLGYLDSGEQNPQMNGNTIVVSLDQDYYRTFVCIRKSGDDAVKKEQTKVYWKGNTYQTFHINNDYASMLVVCLENPKSGSYEIVLPELKSNTYTVLNQTNLNEFSFSAELKGDQVKYVGSDPLTYTIPEGQINGELELFLKVKGLKAEDIKGSYTVSLERMDGITDISGDGSPTDFEWGKNQTEMVVPLRLPEPSPKSDDISAVTYSIQVKLITTADGTVPSDPIKVQLEKLYDPPRKHFDGVVEKEINISPAMWPGFEENMDLEFVEYYMLDQELAKGESLEGKKLLSIPCNTDVYEVCADEGTITICFKAPGQYFMAVSQYGNLKAAATGDFEIEEEKTLGVTSDLKIKGLIGILIAIAVIAVVCIIGCVVKKKRSATESY